MSFAPMPESLLAQLEQYAQIAGRRPPRLILAADRRDHLRLVGPEFPAQASPRPRPAVFEALRPWWVEK